MQCGLPVVLPDSKPGLNPERNYKFNDFFDFEIMPVPLAYTSAFVSHDKGIKDVLRNRTKILERTSCRYCASVSELEEWFKGLPS